MGTPPPRTPHPPRYIIHVASLKQLLVSQKSFRPKLRLQGDVVRTVLYLSDLTSSEGAHVMAVEARAGAGPGAGVGAGPGATSSRVQHIIGLQVGGRPLLLPPSPSP